MTHRAHVVGNSEVLVAGAPRAATDPHADEALLALVREGDVHAFEALFMRYHAPLCTFAFRYVNAEAIAEELVQDVFLYAWRNRIAETLVGNEFRRYLFTAVRNAAISHLRRCRVEQRTAADVASLAVGPAPADRLVTREDQSQMVRRAIAALPGRCREVLVLHRDQGLSYAEIAELLGISRKTVEVHMGRAFRLLRESLAPIAR